MKLVKTSFFSAIITIIRVGSGFVAGKIVAVLIGPSGVALIGQFSNFISIVLNFANGAISNGVVKYTAEFDEDDDTNLKSLFSTAFKISLYCSVVIGVFLLLFSNYYANLIFKDYNLSYIIKVLGITIIFYSFNSLLIAILNGKKEIKKYTIVNTAGSIIGLLLTSYLVYFYKINGALLSLVLSQALVFFVTAVLIFRSAWFKWSFFKMPFNWLLAKKLGHYSLMSIVSILTVPIAQILIRNLLIERFGLDHAGYWQGMMRVSDGYLLIITTSLSTYYLPKLSSIKDEKELREEVLNGFKIIMPVVTFGCIMIYFLRFFIIKTLYTPEFLEMESLFLLQLIGDFFKIATFLFGFIMVAKSMTKYYIITEIVFSAVYVVFTYILTTYLKLQGVVAAFALNYFLCLIYMVFVFRNLIFKRNA